MQLRRLAPIPQLSIVTYHHIADENPAYPYDASIYDATPKQFRRQMELLARYCAMLYQRLGSYAAVAERTGLDPRTARKYVLAGEDR